jgi:1-acyl-sn-glycerol-3-phosphate acyltransferase
MDSLIQLLRIVTVPNRIIRPVAAAYLLDIPVIGFIIGYLLKAIPVARRTDKKGRKVKNSKSLQMMSNVLLEVEHLQSFLKECPIIQLKYWN